MQRVKWKGMQQGNMYGVESSNCPKNLLSDPPLSTTTSDFIENYTDDQALFVEDFSSALVKMLSNKYTSLVDAPYTITQGECSIPEGDSGMFSCTAGNGSETAGEYCYHLLLMSYLSDFSIHGICSVVELS